MPKVKCPNCNSKMEKVDEKRLEVKELRNKYSVYNSKPVLEYSFFNCENCPKKWALNKIRNVFQEIKKEEGSSKN